MLLAIGVELVLLGVIMLWTRLRVRIHDALASMSEGVATAAGLAAILAGAHADMQALAALSRKTFRSVRMDELEQHVLDTNQPTTAAYAASSPAKLGSIDVRCRGCAPLRARPASALVSRTRVARSQLAARRESSGLERRPSCRGRDARALCTCAIRGCVTTPPAQSDRSRACLPPPRAPRCVRDLGSPVASRRVVPLYTCGCTACLRRARRS